MPTPSGGHNGRDAAWTTTEVEVITRVTWRTDVGIDSVDLVRTRAYDGTDFVVTRVRWGHITDRHPELKSTLDRILSVVSSPDEAYEDPRGGIHLVKRVTGLPAAYLVVIVRKSPSETYLVTAHPIGSRRKQRGYRKFRKLPL